MKYLDSINDFINSGGEFMNQTNISYQLNEFFTINKLWSKENKEKQATLLNKLKNINDKKFDDRLVDKEFWEFF